LGPGSMIRGSDDERFTCALTDKVGPLGNVAMSPCKEFGNGVSTLPETVTIGYTFGVAPPGAERPDWQSRPVNDCRALMEALCEILWNRVVMPYPENCRAAEHAH
jgi:hypothetical protein